MANLEPKDDAGEVLTPAPYWRIRFIDCLATTSDVAEAARRSGVTVERALRTRRTDSDFARAWQAALADGYLHLEMEVVRRLRAGDFTGGDGVKYDFANAIRLLAAHRSGKPDASREPDVSPAEVRASIDRKIAEMRRRFLTPPAGPQA